MRQHSSPGTRPLAAMSMLVFLAALGVDAAAEPPRYQNPIVRLRADPWVYRHTDGWYYFTASVPEYDRVEVRRSRTIQGLGSAPAVVVWRRHDTGIMSANIWAPEIHFIGHSWYIYFAAGETVAPFNHRIYVLQNDSPDPLAGLWMEKGQVRTGWESFSLDATEFEHGGAHYLVWAQKDYGIRGNSNLYIAAMNNPWTVAGSAVRISKPEFAWEKKIGGNIPPIKTEHGWLTLYHAVGAPTLITAWALCCSIWRIPASSATVRGIESCSRRSGTNCKAFITACVFLAARW